jgi:ADP-ribosylglycohydrolase
MTNSVTSQTQESAIIGCLLGTAVGDALGLSYEGLSRQRLIKLYPQLDQYHFIGGKGMISDDTEHTCLVAQALIAAHGDLERFKIYLASYLKRWLLMLPAGVGWATLRAILKLMVGFSPNYSGVFSAGNGPAMRSALLGVCYGSNPEKLKRVVKITTRITHTDPKAEWGALAVALAAYLASSHHAITPHDYFTQLQTLLSTEPAQEFMMLIKVALDNLEQSTPDLAILLGLTTGISGYVYHTVPIVIHAWLRNQPHYPAAILEVIRCGGDTDTTAAIVGGIVGSQVGKAGIPAPWLTQLWEFPRHIAWMEQLGHSLNQVCYHNQLPNLPKFSLPLMLLRNAIFMLIVLGHGLRRLLPPY